MCWSRSRKDKPADRMETSPRWCMAHPLNTKHGPRVKHGTLHAHTNDALLPTAFGGAVTAQSTSTASLIPESARNDKGGSAMSGAARSVEGVCGVHGVRGVVSPEGSGFERWNAAAVKSTAASALCNNGEPHGGHFAGGRGRQQGTAPTCATPIATSRPSSQRTVFTCRPLPLVLGARTPPGQTFFPPPLLPAWASVVGERGGGGGLARRLGSVVLVCSRRRLLADRHSLPFPSLSLNEGPFLE